MQRNFTGTFGDDPERIVLPVYLQVALLLAGQCVIEFVCAWKGYLPKPSPCTVLSYLTLQTEAGRCQLQPLIICLIHQFD